MTVKLKYVGDGSYFPGVPADDHETDEATAERLVASGLYEYAEKKKQAAEKPAEERN